MTSDPTRASSAPLAWVALQSRWSVFEIVFWLGALLPFFFFPTYLSLASQIAITALFAISVDLILGYAGIVTLGHAMFFGLGAYTAGLLSARLGWGEPLSGLLLAGAVAGLTALQGIDRELRLKAGETPLVLGASGGVGTLAVQFGKLRCARVLGTASGPAAQRLVRSLGADAVLEPGAPDAETPVLELEVPREQVDAVAASILSLSERSQAIGEIIAAVNDLADQSNLLAVNAAIEAARNAPGSEEIFIVGGGEIYRLARYWL